MIMSPGATISSNTDTPDSVTNNAGATLTMAGDDDQDVATIAAPISNRGTLSVTAGTLDLTGAGVLATGSFLRGPGVISLYGQILEPGVNLIGTPGLWLIGAEVLEAVVLQGASTIRIFNIFGDGSLTIAPGETATMGSIRYISVYLSRARLINRGNLTLVGERWMFLVGGAVLENAGTMTMGPGAYFDPLDSYGSVVNSAGGTMTLSGGATASATIDVPVSNAGTIRLPGGRFVASSLTNTGSVLVGAGTLQTSSYTQTAGVLDVALGATLDAGANDVMVDGGSLTGVGTVKGRLTGRGTITPGRTAGALKIAGSYAPAPTAKLTVGVSGATTIGTDFGQIKVSGAAALTGTLAIKTAAGYLPPVGTEIVIATTGSRTGTFTKVTGRQLSDRHWTVRYAGRTVLLTMVAG